MKHLKMVWHTAIAEKKDPVLELNIHLIGILGHPTPHNRFAPDDLLCNSNFRTKLLDLRSNRTNTRLDIREARAKDADQKALMKK